MAVNLDALFVQVVINIIAITPVLWFSERLFVKSHRTRLIDKLWIALVGTIVYTLFLPLSSVPISSIILLIIWSILINHFFECTGKQSLQMTLTAVLILVVVTGLQAIAGLTASPI